MWLTSNRPTRSRTARCSSMTPEYSTGMSQPPKSTIFAPMLRCTAFKGVFQRAIPLFFDHWPEHVKADHFADHNAAAHGLGADFDDVVDAAFHVDWRFEHARGPDDVAGDGRE